MTESQLQTTLEALIREEAERTVNAPTRYGSFADLSLSAIRLLNTFVLSVNRDHFLSAALMSSVRKSATLGFLSYVRSHTVQAELNSRQLIEFCVLTAYILAHPDEDVTCTADAETGAFRAPKQLSKKAYRWLEESFGQLSTLLKDMKSQINETTSHASIYLTNLTFNWQSQQWGSDAFKGSFFDNQSDDIVRLYLMSHARLVLIVVETIRSVVEKHGGFVLLEDIKERLALLDSSINAHRDALAERMRNPELRT
jgi:hypothetical protein